MFSLVILAVLSVAVVPSVHGSYCDLIQTKDCFHITDRTHVCGTDGVSYRNSCTFSKAYCADNTIHKAHEGDCVGLMMSTSSPVTTPSPIHGSEVAMDIFCLDLDYYDCPLSGTRVCGSDGKFYMNMCEFDKARCFHREMHANGVMCT